MIERAFRNIYEVDHYSRIGLRYVNVFEEQEFPGGWLDKFNAQLLGPLADPVVGGDIAEIVQLFNVSGGDWTITVRHGKDDGAYNLDLDHAVEGRVEASVVLEKLREFNKRIYQVFRWAISEKLHEGMEPGSHD